MGYIVLKTMRRCFMSSGCYFCPLFVEVRMCRNLTEVSAGGIGLSMLADGYAEA